MSQLLCLCRFCSRFCSRAPPPSAMTTTVNLRITSPLLESPYLKAFPSSTILAEFKRRIELVVGIYQADQFLTLLNAEGKYQKDLINEGDTLEQAGIQDDWIINVKSRSGNVDNPLTGSVETYKIDEDKYKQREGNAREFRHQMEAIPKEYVKIGERVVVKTKGKPDRVGVIQYVGNVDFKPGETMVGVALDDASGKHDGNVEGKRYFQCAPGHGIFVSHRNVLPYEDPEENVGKAAEPMEL